MKYNLSTLINEKKKQEELKDDIVFAKNHYNDDTYKRIQERQKENEKSYNLHCDKLQAVLDDVNGKAKERILTVGDILEYTDILINSFNVPVSALNGSYFYIYPHAQKVPNSYKYKYMTTMYCIKIENSKIYMQYISREDSNHNYKFVSELSAEAKKNIIAKYERF